MNEQPIGDDLHPNCSCTFEVAQNEAISEQANPDESGTLPPGYGQVKLPPPLPTGYQHEAALPIGWTQRQCDAAFESRKLRSLKRGSSPADAHAEAQAYVDSLIKSGAKAPTLYTHSHVHGHAPGSELAGTVHRHPHSHISGQPHPDPRLHHHLHGQGAAQLKLSESFKWLMPFKSAFEGLKHIIKGQAITVGVTKNKIPYTEDELMRSARTLTNKPLLINHLESVSEVQEYIASNEPQLHPLVKAALEGLVSRSNVGVGIVNDSEFEDNAVEYVAHVTDPATQACVYHKPPLVLGVSIGAIPRSSGMPPKGIIFTDLSLIMPPEVPADPDATAEIMEKMREMLLRPSPPNLLDVLVELRNRVSRELLSRMHWEEWQRS
jgi:hypothetical protein